MVTAESYISIDTYSTLPRRRKATDKEKWTSLQLARLSPSCEEVDYHLVSMIDPNVHQVREVALDLDHLHSHRVPCRPPALPCRRRSLLPCGLRPYEAHLGGHRYPRIDRLFGHLSLGCDHTCVREALERSCQLTLASTQYTRKGRTDHSRPHPSTAPRHVRHPPATSTVIVLLRV